MIALLATIALATASPTEAIPTVGMPAKLEGLILPGPELEAKPLDDRGAPVVLRVLNSYKHGDGYRYDLSYYGLEPGRYDLRAFLRRKDGTASAGLPEIALTIRPALPPGQIEPHALVPGRSPSLGGYRTLLAAVSFLWLAGFAGILLYRRKPAGADHESGTRPTTLADRLRPLVEAASAGRLGEGQHAELERMLIGYWRGRLGLADADPPAAMAAIRADGRAGPLMDRLEAWLHKPGGAGSASPSEIAALLEPYRDLPADEPVAVPGAAR